MRGPRFTDFRKTQVAHYSVGQRNAGRDSQWTAFAAGAIASAVLAGTLVAFNQRRPKSEDTSVAIKHADRFTMIRVG